MLRDPNAYKTPEIFNPSRFLGSLAEGNPEEIIFGFGRRYVHALPS
jgi:cytochrome P450